MYGFNFGSRYRNYYFSTKVSYVNLATSLKPDIKLSALLVVENSIYALT